MGGTSAMCAWWLMSCCTISQAPFDLLLHKTTDLLAQRDSPAAQAALAHINVRALENLTIYCVFIAAVIGISIMRVGLDLQDYLSRHPSTVVIDPIDRTIVLLDRHLTSLAIAVRSY